LNCFKYDDFFTCCRNYYSRDEVEVKGEVEVEGEVKGWVWV